MNRFRKIEQKIILGIIGAMLALVLVACGEDTATSNRPSSNSTPTVTPAPGSPGTATTITPAPVSTPAVSAAGALDSTALKTQVRDSLGKLWDTYKQRYIQQDGRVKDPQRADASTSEGQSYALLRAFWEDDRTTFDSVLNWSLSNLQLPRGDKLFAYLWGKSSDNSWKVLDQSAATDADQDTAFALLLASQKWNEPSYKTLAQQILGDIWNKTLVQVNGRPYLTAGDWSPTLAQPVLNPSYLSPYEYRLFAQADPDKSHDWQGLVDTSYEIIKGCTTAKLDSTSGKLPPNWCAVDKQSGAFVPAHDATNSFDSNYGYDAFRTVWRLALDYRWYGEKRALDYLQSLDVLPTEWKSKQKLAVSYDHAGQPKDNSEDLGIYSGSGLGLFLTVDPPLADQIVATKLLPALAKVGQDDPDPAHLDASKARTYYAQNWTWFGLALYADALPRP